MIKIGIFAASGSYGKQLCIDLSGKKDKFSLVGASVRSGHKFDGQLVDDVYHTKHGKVIFSADLEKVVANADVMVDFSHPDAFDDYLAIVQKYQIPFISATTGLTDNQFSELREVAKEIPILWSSNMSLGVNLLQKITQMLSSKLDDDFDIEIFDTHHRNKVDAPSGTALTLGKIVAEARRVKFDQVKKMSREGHVGPRKKGEIGFSSLRAGSVIAEVGVLFANMSERIKIEHIADSKTIFTNGALSAAEWIIHQSNGLYSMQDVLELGNE